MVVLDSDKVQKLVEHYQGSPMIHSILEVFYKQCVMYCGLTKCCANCNHRYGKHCRKWKSTTRMNECCPEWVVRDAE